MRKLVFVLLFCFISIAPIYASWISDFFTGDSQDKRNAKASQALESLINDGSVAFDNETESFASIIGSTLDMTLISIRSALSPSIANLSLSSSDKPHLINKNSFMGMLIYLFIVLECIILGISAFLSSSRNIKEIIKQFFSILVVLIFIAFLPLVCDAVLNIFTSLGMVMSGNTQFSSPTPEHPFSYMPSDALYTLNICKRMLAVEHIRIGGYDLGTLIPHFFVNIGEFIVTIPFIFLMLMIVFWYTEMFLIFVAGYITLPFSILSKLEITNYKTILKSMIMQGVKISVGIFLSTFIKDIIIGCLKMLDSSFTSTIHAVLFTIFITLIVFFIISKGTSVIMSAITGSTNDTSRNPLAFSAGVITGAIAGISQTLSSPFSKKSNSSAHKEINSDKQFENSNPPLVDKIHQGNHNNNSKNNNLGETQVIQNSNNTANSIKGYGEVTALATRERMNAARLEMYNEGLKNPTEEQVVAKAKNDAIIAKLLKMEKKGFILEGGVFNKPAAEQLKRLRGEK